MSFNVVKPGDLVYVHYSTLSQDQCVIESSENRDPLMFIAGAGAVVDGVDRAVLGMRVGESKRVPVMPEHGFGQRDPRWVQSAPRWGLPDRITDGDQLEAVLQGESLDVWIRGLQSDSVTLDANHPLAGETLVYDLRIVSVGPPAPADSVFG